MFDTRTTRRRPIVRLLEAAMRRRGLVAWAVAIATLVASFGLAGLRVENDFSIWFDRDAAVYEAYTRFKSDFGSDETIIVIYRSDSLFAPSQVALNRRLTAALDALPAVSSVTSLTSLDVPLISSLGVRWVPLVPGRQPNEERLREAILGKRSLLDTIVSQDGRATGITVRLMGERRAEREQALKQVREVLSSPVFATTEAYLVGNIPLKLELARLADRESVRFVLICVVVMAALLFAVFRSLRTALLAVAASLITVAAALGLFAALGHSINMVSGIMPLVLIVISVSGTVHVVDRLSRPDCAGISEVRMRAEALAEIFWPCLFSALTTAAAFLSFVFSALGPVRALGAFTGIGVLFAFTVSFVVVPAFLGTHHPRRSPSDDEPWGQAIGRLTARIVRARFPVLGIALVVLWIAIAGFLRVTFETDQISYFKPSNPMRQANEIAQHWFAGVFWLDAVLTFPEPIAENPDGVYELLTELEEALGVVHGVVRVQTVTTLLEDFVPEEARRKLAFAAYARSAQTGDEESDRRLRLRFISEGGRKVRISVKTRWMDNQRAQGLMDRLERVVEPRLSRFGASVSFVGLVPLYIYINKKVTESQIRSFASSFVVIFLLMLALFRHPMTAVIAMVPNVLPILTTVGLMGWLGVPLDVATVLITAISLGIAVDDTIHLIWHYRQEDDPNKEVLEVLVRSTSSVGKPIVVTTMLLVAGFLTMLASDYVPIQLLGLFVSLNVFFALIYDLVLLPAIIAVRRL